MIGCSQVNPEISATEDLPALEINPPSKSFTSKNLPALDVTINGSVSKFANKLQVSSDDGASWQDLTSSMVQGLAINQSLCVNLCPFTFSVVDVGSKWPRLAALTIDGEAKILLRGMGQFGTTVPGFILFKRIRGGFISIGSIAGVAGSKANRVLSGSQYRVIGSKLQANAGKTLTGTSINAKGAQR